MKLSCSVLQPVMGQLDRQYVNESTTWWNDDLQCKPKFCKRNLSHCHFVHHRWHMDCPEIKPGLLQWKTGS